MSRSYSPAARAANSRPMELKPPGRRAAAGAKQTVASRAIERRRVGRLSCVVPCWNEAANLRRLLPLLSQMLDEHETVEHGHAFLFAVGHQRPQVFRMSWAISSLTAFKLSMARS